MCVTKNAQTNCHCVSSQFFASKTQEMHFRGNTAITIASFSPFSHSTLINIHYSSLIIGINLAIETSFIRTMSNFPILVKMPLIGCESPGYSSENGSDWLIYKYNKYNLCSTGYSHKLWTTYLFTTKQLNILDRNSIQT